MHAWLWTGFSVHFNIMDLELKCIVAPPLASPVNITVINNASLTEGATWDFEEYWREVYMPATPPPGNFRAHMGDYTGTAILNTGSEYSLMLRWFTYLGTANVYLDDALVKSGIALDYQGRANTNITIPTVPTGDYLFRVVDYFHVYYFTVHIEQSWMLVYHDVVFDQTTYVVETCSNSTVSDLTFNQELARIRFNVDGTTGTTGFCNITIPAELMSGDFSIYNDDVLLVENVDYTKTYNGTHYHFSIIYEHSTHMIEIFSSEVIPELSSLMLLLTFIIATVVVIICACKKRG